MAGVPPMGVRPPMMFGPLPPGFPLAGFQQPPRLPFGAPQDKAGGEGEMTGADGETGKPEDSGGAGDNNADESLHEEADAAAAVAGIPFQGNFPRPPMMGHGDWHMRGPVPPFMGGPNMPRPDQLRGPPPPRALLGDGPRPTPMLRAPPRFSLPENFPPNPEEEESEEYYDEYGEEEEGNEEEEYNQDYDEEEEEYEEYDGNDYFICFLLIIVLTDLHVGISYSTNLVYADLRYCSS